MIGTKLLLDNKIKNLPKSKRRSYLINCIEKNNIIKFLDDVQSNLETKIIDRQMDASSELFCKLCKKYDFIKTNYSEICQNCGLERVLAPTQKNFEKIEYIKPGSNILKISSDSKKITVNLNKIDSWLKDTDPLYNDINKIIENLEIIFQTKGIELPKNVQNSAISLLYNFNTLFQNFDISTKKIYNKKAIISLCIYYGSLINDYNISLEQISILIKVNVSDIIQTNSLFKDVFKDTDYYKYLILSEKIICNIQLSPKNKIIFLKIKNDLIKNFSYIKEPLQNKEYSAIIYFITNKINTVIKYTLKELEEKCNVSTTTISNLSKSIERFYKNNPKLYKELLI